MEFDALVERYYQPLFRFAMSLSRSEAEASDLTQQTFFRWAQKGHQLRDGGKAKSWLFTTLYREFIGQKRRQTKFQHHEIEEVEHELPSHDASVVNDLDGATVMDCLSRVEELYRGPLSLFYIEGHSYQEIAQILEVPIGTVMSRLSRGKGQLRKLLSEAGTETGGRVVEPPADVWRSKENHG